MPNFAKKIEKASKIELYSWVNELDFRVVPLASDELTRRSLKKMREATKLFNEQSSKQTKKIIYLTKWIVALTVVMTLGLIMQIILAFIN